jgi:hypothetical protein
MPHGPRPLKLGRTTVKVNIEFDCTPEEARRLVGLPDLTPLHDRYVATLQDALGGGIKPEMLEPLLRSWAPMGEAGLSFWRRMAESAMRGGKPGE